MVRDQPRDARQRLGRVVGRQQLATPRKARAFFQMQIGDDKQTLLGPIQCPEAVRVKRHGGNRQRGLALRRPCPTLPLKEGGNRPSLRPVQLIASLISSASASASSASD